MSKCKSIVLKEIRMGLHEAVPVWEIMLFVVVGLFLGVMTGLSPLKGSIFAVLAGPALLLFGEVFKRPLDEVVRFEKEYEKRHGRKNTEAVEIRQEACWKTMLMVVAAIVAAYGAVIVAQTARLL